MAEQATEVLFHTALFAQHAAAKAKLGVTNVGGAEKFVITMRNVVRSKPKKILHNSREQARQT